MNYLESIDSSKSINVKQYHFGVAPLKKHVNVTISQYQFNTICQFIRQWLFSKIYNAIEPLLLHSLLFVPTVKILKHN